MEINNMPFKMGMTKEDLNGPPPVAPGVYELQVTGFRPKISKAGTSLNYNAEFTITNHPSDDGRKVFHPLNTSFGVAIRDFSHACGCALETITVPGDIDTPQHEEQVLPGAFENADKYPDDPSKWGKYIGPLTNKIFKAELAITSYNGKPKNEVRLFFCALQDCAIKEPDLKHSMNLIKASS
jgi:hypothetical protein